MQEKIEMYTRQKETGQARTTLRSERGASMVEFALVAPLLFVLLFGIIEFGLILYDQAFITNASREGARYAAMYYINPSGQPQQHACSDVQNYVTTYVTTNLIDFASPPASPTISCSLEQNDEGVGLMQSVTVSYPYKFLVSGSLITLTNGSVKNPLTLTATTVMRLDNQSQHESTAAWTSKNGEAARGGQTHSLSRG
jgi:Flp pilus assembly protein TadG